MSIINFERDMAWIDPDIAPLQMVADQYICDGNLYDKHAYATCAQNAVTTTSACGFGVLMTPPVYTAATPYRVKCDIVVNGEGVPVMHLGYVETPAVGSVTVVGLRTYGFGAESIYDDVWAIRPSTNYPDHALYIGIGLYKPTSAVCAGKISVQRLVGKPDNYKIGVA